MNDFLTSSEFYQEVITKLPSWVRAFFPGENMLEVFLYNAAQAILLFIVAWSVVTYLERRHLKAIGAQEKNLSDIHLNTLRKSHEQTSDGVMVAGSVVIAHDFVRSFLIFWRKLFGGNISYYDRLVIKGRRVAVVRMKEEANLRGMSKVVGVRFTTTALTNRKRVKGVEIVAYGTAVK